jgi:hypothetical protein
MLESRNLMHRSLHNWQLLQSLTTIPQPPLSHVSNGNNKLHAPSTSCERSLLGFACTHRALKPGACISIHSHGTLVNRLVTDCLTDCLTDSTLSTPSIRTKQDMKPPHLQDPEMQYTPSTHLLIFPAPLLTTFLRGCRGRERGRWITR